MWRREELSRGERKDLECAGEWEWVEGRGLVGEEKDRTLKANLVDVTRKSTEAYSNKPLVKRLVPLGFYNTRRKKKRKKEKEKQKSESDPERKEGWREDWPRIK